MTAIPMATGGGGGDGRAGQAEEASLGMVLIVMGPAGAGKTTVGRHLAAALGWAFHDGDDFHPPVNVARMQAGLPLEEADRVPWLAALAALVADTVARGRRVVLACSALRRAYRHMLVAGVPGPVRAAAVRVVYLDADPALLAERLTRRGGHFFAAALLPSQLAALEEPEEGDEPVPVIRVDAANDPDRLVGTIRATLAV
jgi:carbohydrate kinase (thermoresistant glucokinase family)